MKVDMSATDCKNSKRALCKVLLIAIIAALIVAGLSQLVTDQALDELKYSLNLGTIVILVIVINIVSFTCFLIFYTLYQWVKKDLKEKPEVDEDDPLDV